MKQKYDLHRVNVVYRPEPGETESSEECLSFSKWENAQDFATRMRKNPKVISAKYLGMKG